MQKCIGTYIGESNLIKKFISALWNGYEAESYYSNHSALVENEPFLENSILFRPSRKLLLKAVVRARDTEMREPILKEKWISV